MGIFNWSNKPKRRPKKIKSDTSLECKVDGTSKYCGKDKPLRPMIARAGGKSQLANKIISKMKPHESYNEPFLGGGAVFLKKPLAKKNYINDKDKDVVAVFKTFKNGVGFQKCDMTPSKKKFDKIKNKKDKSACDVVYLNKLSFGSSGTTFALGENMHKKKDPSYKKRWGHIVNNKNAGIGYQKAHIDDYKEKLKNTTIMATDFKKAVEATKNIKDSVTFMDPPYYGADKMYKERGVTPKEVCDVAKQMKGQVIITYNDVPEVRKHCSKGFKVEKISSRFILQADSNNKKSKELLIIKN